MIFHLISYCLVFFWILFSFFPFLRELYFTALRIENQYNIYLETIIELLHIQSKETYSLISSLSPSSGSRFVRESM